MHLTHIAQAFASGDFDIPMFVHDTVPPGVPEMKRLREKIHYSFEDTASGGRVVISSTDKDAIGLQGTPDLNQCTGQIVHPMKGHAGQDCILRRFGKRKLLFVDHLTFDGHW